MSSDMQRRVQAARAKVAQEREAAAAQEQAQARVQARQAELREAEERTAAAQRVMEATRSEDRAAAVSLPDSSRSGPAATGFKPPISASRQTR